MHAFESVYNKDTLPCLCLAKSKDRERTKRIGAMEYNVECIELVPPSAPSAHSTPQHHPSESAARARFTRFSASTRPQCVPNLQQVVCSRRINMYLRTLRLNLAFML